MSKIVGYLTISRVGPTTQVHDAAPPQPAPQQKSARSALNPHPYG